MSNRKLLTVFWAFMACSKLDPKGFPMKGAPPGDLGEAGWYFDAGPGSDLGGRPSSGHVGGTGFGGRPGVSGGSTLEGGEAGQAGEAGAAAPDGGKGGTGGMGGLAGGRAGSSGQAGGGHGGRAVGGQSSGGAGASGARASNGGGGSDASAGASPTGGAGNGAGGAPAVHALYFSEYVEGSSSYKALEITAREPSSLSGCRLVTYFNGASMGTGIALDGAVSGGKTYVLCSTALATQLGAACDRATNLTFNGDDAVALECDGVTLDVIGQIGVDPGDAWGTDETTTLNHTLRRECEATAGDRDGTDPFDPSLEWTGFAADTFDGLGLTECGGG